MFSPERFGRPLRYDERCRMKVRRTLRRRERRRKQQLEKRSTAEQECQKSKDERGHCPHWWDGEICCWCEAPAMTRAEMVEQGMIE